MTERKCTRNIKKSFFYLLISGWSNVFWGVKEHPLLHDDSACHVIDINDGY